jgi:hypothetical protein
MEDHRFDELTQSLANRISRRGVLKVLAAATVSGWLARAGAGEAWADKGGNSDCAHWCNAHFAGEDRGDCKSDAAHGEGLCHSPCRPGGGGGTLCGGPDYESTTCCSSSQGCVDGTCVSCPSGSVFCHGACCPLRANTTASCVNNTCTSTCVAGRTMLSNGTCALACSSSTPCPSGCACVPSLSGAIYCATGVHTTACTGDAACGIGQFCNNAGTCQFTC